MRKIQIILKLRKTVYETRYGNREVLLFIPSYKRNSSLSMQNILCIYYNSIVALHDTRENYFYFLMFFIVFLISVINAKKDTKDRLLVYKVYQ